MAPVVNARILAWLIPGARLEVVRGGHLFLLELAPSAANLVGGFLHEAARPGGGGPAESGYLRAWGRRCPHDFQSPVEERV